MGSLELQESAKKGSTLREITRQFLLHAEEEFPREAVGKVVADSYVRLKNAHEDPEHHFRLERYPDDAVYLLHSHTQFRTQPLTGRRFVSAAPSRADMECQQEMRIPWGIQPMQSNGPAGPMEFFGDQVMIPPLLGRTFLSGSRDCWCLVRDLYRKQWDIVLPNLPRDEDWYRQDGPEYDLLSSEQIAAAGFVEIDMAEARPGDVVLGSVASQRTNHTGLICARGLVLHQIEGRDSRREPINPWQRYIHRVVRHPGAGEWDGETIP